ncbi:hypothetical protein, partial [Bacillus anthracis]|uniref:hypothetical protein n=1 Tax=Bacillus anthracis TaxID=1392 RepID=UPI0009AC3C98
TNPSYNLLIFSLSSRQYLKSATKQPEFYIYMDSGYLISLEIVDDYKKYIFAHGNFNLIRFTEDGLMKILCLKRGTY